MAQRWGKHKVSKREHDLLLRDSENNSPATLTVGGGYGSDGLTVDADGNVTTDGSLKCTSVHFNDGTPVALQASANQIALTDSSGGSAGNETLAACADTSTGDRSGTINDNFAKTAVLLNEIRQCLVDVGLIKGAA